jgi:hypothetical protein
MASPESTFISEPTGQHLSRAALDEIVSINPLEVPDWDLLISSNRNSSFFHTQGWARVLHETYGHEPLYFCRIESSRVQVLLPAMEVRSWLTGTRGVSLPFTDFCPILLESLERSDTLFERVLNHGRAQGWRYFEIRSSALANREAEPSVSFYGHFLDLGGSTEHLWTGLSGAVRRGIRKSEQERLRIEMSSSIEGMRTFFSLHCRTRRRHGVPPQPIAFFENIARHILRAGRGFIALAVLQDRPVAAAVFFHNARQAIYKFGASDFRYQHLRPNNLLMWEAIKHCVELGCNSLHLGRTSQDQQGLRRFKLGFGAQEQSIDYYKYDFGKEAFVRATDLARNRLAAVFKLFPPPMFRLAGRLLYPHLS